VQPLSPTEQNKLIRKLLMKAEHAAAHLILPDALDSLCAVIVG